MRYSFERIFTDWHCLQKADIQRFFTTLRIYRCILLSVTVHPNKGFSVPVSEPYKVGLTAAFLHQFSVVEALFKTRYPYKIHIHVQNFGCKEI